MPNGNTNPSPAAKIEIKQDLKAEAKKPFTVDVDTKDIKAQRGEVMDANTKERLALMENIFKGKNMPPPPFLEKPKIENKEQVA